MKREFRLAAEEAVARARAAGVEPQGHEVPKRVRKYNKWDKSSMPDSEEAIVDWLKQRVAEFLKPQRKL